MPKHAKRRPVLGLDPFDTMTSTAPQPATRHAAAPATPKPGRAQLNVLFDSWDWPDYVKAAAYIERRLPREVLADALKAYEEALTPTRRKEIRAYAETVTTARSSRKPA